MQRFVNLLRELALVLFGYYEEVRKTDINNDISCCHGSGLESRLRYIQDIYSFHEDKLYVNLYILSDLDTGKVKLKQCSSGLTQAPQKSH